MSTEKTGVGKILQGFWHLLSGIFKHSSKAIEKDYNALPAETKALFQSGVGVMQFIGEEVGKEPAIIKEEILVQFPNLNVDDLQKGLYGIAHAFNLAPNENDIEGTIAKLQAHIASLKGKVWETIMDTGANLFAFLIAPAGSKLEAGFGFAKYIYLKFFKK